jgi:hypothetical protein
MASPSSTVVIAVRYPRLYEAARTVLRDTLDLLQTKMPTPVQWPTRTIQKPVFDTPTTSHLETVLEAFPGDVVMGMQAELDSLASHGDAVRELQRLEQQGMAVPWFVSLSQTFLLPIFADYLQQQRSLQFDEEVFRRAYGRVEEYVASDTATGRLYLTLFCAGGTEAEVRLSKMHRLYRIDEVEAQRLWRLMAVPALGAPGWQFHRAWPRVWPHPGFYVLASTFSCAKTEVGNMVNLLIAEEAQVVRALRLSGMGGAVQYLTYEEIGFVPGLFRPALPDILKPLYGPPDLSAATAGTLRKHWPAAYDMSSALQRNPEKMEPHLRISVGRFNSSFDKHLNEDKLIDYFIAFEALFTKENDSISYRLPLRVAIFAGDDPLERERIFSIVRTGYDLRSSLAHGKDQLTDSVKVGKQRLPIAEFIKELHQILFTSVHRFVGCDKTSTKDAVIRAIDDAAVSLDRSGLEKLWS